MPRIYIGSPEILKDQIVLKEPQKIHYLKDVLRLKVKDKVTVFDTEANEYQCEIRNMAQEQIVLGIEKKGSALVILPYITVAPALIKRTKRMDDLMDKLTQLGVYRIIPLLSHRVVVRLNKERMENKLLRWQKIAISASQQSARGFVPVIEEISYLDDVVEKENASLKLILTLYGKRTSLKSLFLNRVPSDILILVGPEGDFTPQEIRKAKDKGFIPVSLGNLVLRTETAAVSAVSFIRLYAEG